MTALNLVQLWLKVYSTYIMFCIQVKFKTNSSILKLYKKIKNFSCKWCCFIKARLRVSV